MLYKVDEKEETYPVRGEPFKTDATVRVCSQWGIDL